MDISSITYILVVVLTIIVLTFTIVLLWRLWCVLGYLSDLLQYLRINSRRIGELITQIERFCRIYADAENAEKFDSKD